MMDVDFIKRLMEALPSVLLWSEEAWRGAGPGTFVLAALRVCSTAMTTLSAAQSLLAISRRCPSQGEQRRRCFMCIPLSAPEPAVAAEPLRRLGLPVVASHRLHMARMGRALRRHGAEGGGSTSVRSIQNLRACGGRAGA